MTRLVDQVRARDGRVVATRCASCGVIFLNRPVGLSWRAHDDHTWTHVLPAGGMTERTAP